MLSTFLSLWFIVTISTCDNTGLCGLWPTSVWLTDYSSYWLLISVPDWQCIFFAMIHNQFWNFWILTESLQLKRCWWYSFVNLEDAFDVADENFWWILDSIEIYHLLVFCIHYLVWKVLLTAYNSQSWYFCTYVYCLMTWNFTFVSWVLKMWQRHNFLEFHFVVSSNR